MAEVETEKISVELVKDTIFAKYQFKDTKRLGLIFEGFGYADRFPDFRDEPIYEFVCEEFKKIAERVAEMLEK